MTGGLLQLIAQGPENIFMSNNPEITLFKTIFRRYSNYTVDTKILEFNKKAGFDTKSICKLRRYGDLLHKLILVIELPDINMTYVALTNKTVFDMLNTFGIIWEYTGEPTDNVDQIQLPSIKDAITEQVNNLESYISYINNNYLNHLNEIYNVYKIDDQYKNDTGMQFIENYVSGINDGLNMYIGLAYNEQDSQITPIILSEYDFLESYKKDSIKTNVYNLGSVHVLTYETYVKYVLDRQYMSSNKGNISNPTLNSIQITNSDNQNDIYKNWYIKTGILISRISSSSLTNNTITTYGNFDFIPSITDQYQLLSTPSFNLSGTIGNQSTSIIMHKTLFNSDDDYYANWFCKVSTNNDSIFKISNFLPLQNILVLDSNLMGTVKTNDTFIISKATIYGTLRSAQLNNNNTTTIIIDTASPELNGTDNYYDGWYLYCNNKSYVIMTYTASNLSCIIVGLMSPLPTYDTPYYIVKIPLTTETTILNSKLEITSSIFVNGNNYKNTYIFIGNNDTNNNSHIMTINTDTVTNNTVGIELQTGQYVPVIGDNVNMLSGVIFGMGSPGISTSKVTFAKNTLGYTNGYYNGWYFYCNSELHQFDSYIVSESNEIATLLDDFVTIPDMNSDFYLFQEIQEHVYIEIAEQNTVTLINILHNENDYYSNWYIYCNSQLIKVLNNENNVFVLETEWTNIPLSGNMCYLIAPHNSSIHGIIDSASVTSTINLNDNFSNIDDTYTNWYICVNSEMHQIISYIGSTLTVTIADKWNIIPDKENKYALINTILVSGIITDVNGNNSLLLTPSLNNLTNKYIYGQQQLLQISDYDSESGIVTFATNFTNIPINNNNCYIYDEMDTMQYHTGIVDVLPINKLTRILINDSLQNIDCTSYYLYIQHQLTMIKYFDIKTGVCILHDSFIYPITGPVVNDTCIIFPETSLNVSETGISSNCTSINVSNAYYATITLQSTANPTNGYYVGWYISVVSITGITELFVITSYDGTNKVATLDSNWINGIPSLSSIYNLYDTIPNQISSIITHLTNNIIALDKKDLPQGDYKGFYISIGSDISVINYYDIQNRICILHTELYAPIKQREDTYILYSGLAESGTIDSKTDYVLQLQNMMLSTETNYYKGDYINLGQEFYPITAYDGKTNDISIGTHTWINTYTNGTTYNIIHFNHKYYVQTSDLAHHTITIKTNKTYLADHFSDWLTVINNTILVINNSTETDQTTDTITLTISQMTSVPIINSLIYLYENPTIYMITAYNTTQTSITIRLPSPQPTNYFSGWYIIFNNQLLKILSSTNSQVCVLTLSAMPFRPLKTNIPAYLYEDITILNTGMIIETYTTGVILNNYDLNISNNFYNGWFVQIGKSISEITVYCGNNTNAIITESESIISQNNIIGKSYKLFPRLLNNIEIASIQSVIDTNIIKIAIQSSKYDNYYNGWYLQINNESKKINSYNGNNRTVTLEDQFTLLPTAGTFYKLYNRILEDNLVFYNILQLGPYSVPISLLGFPVKQLFDIVVDTGYSGMSSYIGLDAYNAYLYYFNNSTNVSGVTITYSLNVNQILTDLLAYILTTLTSNMLQLQQIFTVLQNSTSSDPHFIFAFYNVFPIGQTGKYTSINGSFTNASTQSITSTGDNFTNKFAISTPGYYATYVSQSLATFNTKNTTYFNNNTFIEYLNDSNVWKVSVTSNNSASNIYSLLLNANQPSTTKNNLYLLNYAPLLAVTDIPILVNNRLTTYFSNNYAGDTTDTITRYLDKLSNELIIGATLIVNMISSDLEVSAYDNSYLTAVTSNTQKGINDAILVGIFRPENTYTFIAKNGTSYSNLTSLEYTCYNLLDIAINTTLNYDFSGLFNNQTNKISSIALNNELVIQITNIINTFLTPSSDIPSYSTYVTNGYSFHTGDTPYLANALTSIWYNIWKQLLDSYNSLFYGTLLANSYITKNLGFNMLNLLNQSSDIMQTDLSTYTNYYQFNITYIPNVITTITNEINTFSGLISNYNKGNTILQIKNIIIPPTNYYFSSFDDIYKNGITGQIKTQPIFNTWLLTNTSYAETIINGTYNILRQYVYCTMDIIGNANTLNAAIASNLTVQSTNVLNTFYNATIAQTNPFTTDSYLSQWYMTYINNASSTDFIDYIAKLTPQYLYENIENIIGNYNGFGEKNNIIQFLSDYIIRRTNLGTLFSNAKGNWYTTYNNLLTSFNKTLNEYYKDLIGIGTDVSGTKLYNTIYNAVTNQNADFAWVQYLGYALIDKCYIDVGGCIIDEQTGEYLYLKNQLEMQSGKQSGLNKMIGNTPDLYTYNAITKKGRKLYIPLDFWFCKYPANSLPLVGMNYTDVTLGLHLKKLEEVAYWNSMSEFKKKPTIKCSIMATYIYVEESERKIIAESKHEQLIETVQHNTVILSGKNLVNGIFEPKIYFKNMVKDIIWTIQPTVNTDGTLSINGVSLGERKWFEYKYYVKTINQAIKGQYKLVPLEQNDINNSKPNPFIIINGVNSIMPHNNLTTDISGNVVDDNNHIVLPYQYNTEFDRQYVLNKTIINYKDIYIDPIVSAIIKMNGIDREAKKDAKFYNAVIPYTRRNASIPGGMYEYSFGLYPNILQPTGAINMSQIENCSIVLEIDNLLVQDLLSKGIKLKISVYGITSTMFRVLSGMAGVAFLDK